MRLVAFTLLGMVLQTLFLAASVLARGPGVPPAQSPVSPAASSVLVFAPGRGQPCAIPLADAAPRNTQAMDPLMAVPGLPNPPGLAADQVPLPAPPCGETGSRNGIVVSVFRNFTPKLTLAPSVLQEPGLFSPPWAAQAKPAGARKLAPSLAALVESVRKSGRPGGETAVHITLANAPPDSLAQLRKLGFTIVLRTRDEVIGRIAVEKLEALAQLPFVVRIAPQ